MISRVQIGPIDYARMSVLLKTAVGLAVDTGTVSSATSNTLTDRAKDWGADMWSNAVVEIIDGTGKGQVRRIKGNTSNTLTVEPDWTVVPDWTSVYVIRLTGMWMMELVNNPQRELGIVESIRKWGGVQVTGRDISLDLAMLQNIDVSLSSRASEATVLAMKSELDNFASLLVVSYTTTPLGANEAWTSAVDSDARTGRIVGSVFADQPGTLYVEQSPDGANWDVVESFPVSANAGLGFSVEKVVPYARVRYVNGATAQSVFRLYVYKRFRVL